MIEYLRNYISNEDYELIKTTLDKEMIKNFNIMKETVSENLMFFQNSGIQSLTNIVIYRPDLCFKSKSHLEESFEKIDMALLKYIIEENINDLSMFGI